MVDLAEIQAAYYMVAATGVLVAAAYYVLNMRATLQTRRISLIDSIPNRVVNTEGMSKYFELMNYEWSDYGDFERKYGSDNNVEATAKRFSLWVEFNSMGAMVRKGMIRAEDLYDMGLTSPVYFWAKYMPIIEENRRRYNGEGYLRDFEYLAGELLRVMKEHDPTYSLPEALTKYIPDK